MKFVAILLTALLFSGAALSDSYRAVVRYTPHGQVRVVQHGAHRNVTVLAPRANRRPVAVVYRAHRPSYRRVAVVAYRPHTIYRRHFHNHNAHCHH